MREPIYAGGGYRVYDNPIVASQLQDPLLTAFVLTTAALEEDDPANLPGYKLFPELEVANYRFYVPKVGDEHLVVHDLARGWRGKIRTVNSAITRELRELIRFTDQGAVDDDEILNQTSPLNASARATLLARRILYKSLEHRKAALVANDANFGLVQPITSGNGWNELATALFADIDIAASYLEGTTSVDRSKFKLALFGKARMAARSNEELRNAKQISGKGVGFPTFAEVADFLNIGEVWGAMPVEKLSIEAAATATYGDVAILYYSGNPSRLATIEGDKVWGRTPTLGPGAALTAYRDPETTSMLYPWQKREDTFIFDPTAAVKFTGVWQE